MVQGEAGKQTSILAKNNVVSAIIQVCTNCQGGIKDWSNGKQGPVQEK